MKALLPSLPGKIKIQLRRGHTGTGCGGFHPVVGQIMYQTSCNQHKQTVDVEFHPEMNCKCGEQWLGHEILDVMGGEVEGGTG